MHVIFPFEQTYVVIISSIILAEVVHEVAIFINIAIS